jgi:hypothetical protein
VAVGGTSTGEVESLSDRDWFSIDLVSGTEYRISLVGNSLSNPYLRGVYTSSGDLISGSSNDNFGTGGGWGSRTSRVNFTPVQSGVHYISASGNETDWTECRTMYSGCPFDDDGVGTYSLSVVIETSPDIGTTLAEAATLTVGSSRNGVFERPSDRDLYEVQLELATTYTITVEGYTAHRGGAPIPRVDEILDSNGNSVSLPTVYYANFGRERTLFRPPSTGSFYFSVTSAPTRTSPSRDGTGKYRLNISANNDDSTWRAPIQWTLGSRAHGRIDFADPQGRSHDVDWFSIDLEADRVYRFEPNGHGHNVPIVAVTSTPGRRYTAYPGTDGRAGKRYASSRSYNPLGAHPQVDFVPPSAGTYYVVVTHVTDQSRDRYVTGDYTISVRDATDDYSEGTDNAGSVVVGDASGTQGELHYRWDRPNWYDRDWFAVSLGAGMQYRIEVKGGASGHGNAENAFIRRIVRVVGGVEEDQARREVEKPFDTSCCSHFNDGPFIDTDGGHRRSSLHFFTPDATGTYYIEVGDYLPQLFNSVPSERQTYTVFVTAAVPDDCTVMPGGACSITVGGTEHGSIERAPGGLSRLDDRDWYGVELTRGVRYRVDVLGSYFGYCQDGRQVAYGTSGYPNIGAIHDANGVSLEQFRDVYTSGGVPYRVLGQRYLTFTAPTTGMHYIEVTSRSEGTYELRLDEEANRRYFSPQLSYLPRDC